MNNWISEPLLQRLSVRTTVEIFLHPLHLIGEGWVVERDAAKDLAELFINTADNMEVELADADGNCYIYCRYDGGSWDIGGIIDLRLGWGALDPLFDVMDNLTDNDGNWLFYLEGDDPIIYMEKWDDAILAKLNGKAFIAGTGKIIKVVNNGI